MSKLYDQDHVPTILTRMGVVLLRLGAHPKTQGLVPPVAAAKAALEAADGEWGAAVVAALAASLELDYLDDEVDVAWMDLSRDVKARVSGNRDHATWRGLYGEAPSDTIIGRATDHQTMNVERVIATIEADDTYRDFRPQAQRLAAAQADMQQGQQRYKAAVAKETAAAHKRILAAHDARRAHNRIKAELELLFEDQPRRVKAFWS